MEKSIDSWQDMEILVNDYRLALEEQNNNFSKKILTFLNMGPQTLVDEFNNHPNAVLTSKNGADWMSLWAGGVKIDCELYKHSTVIKKIEELLKGGKNA